MSQVASRQVLHLHMRILCTRGANNQRAGLPLSPARMMQC